MEFLIIVVVVAIVVMIFSPRSDPQHPSKMSRRQLEQELVRLRAENNNHLSAQLLREYGLNQYSPDSQYRNNSMQQDSGGCMGILLPILLFIIGIIFVAATVA